MKAKIGIIGGSGLYNIEGAKILSEEAVFTPFGDPSDKLSVFTGPARACTYREKGPVSSASSPVLIWDLS